MGCTCIATFEPCLKLEFVFFIPVKYCEFDYEKLIEKLSSIAKHIAGNVY